MLMTLTESVEKEDIDQIPLTYFGARAECLANSSRFDVVLMALRGGEVSQGALQGTKKYLESVKRVRDAIPDDCSLDPFDLRKYVFFSKAIPCTHIMPDFYSVNLEKYIKYLDNVREIPQEERDELIAIFERLSDSYFHRENQLAARPGDLDTRI